ncbi:MAG: YceI family protein [Thiohalomonadales bacterium]
MRLLLPAIVASILIPASAFAASYKIDPLHTYPNFTISHLGFSTMHGRFGKTSGSMEMDLDKGTGSVNIIVETASVNTGHKKRDDHLRSPDFFNAVEFPQITYKSTKVTFMGKNKASINGDLTIKGVSKPVTLEVSHIKCGVHPFSKKQICGFDASTKIKRSDFGIKYGLPAIGDDINLSFEIEAEKI